MAKPDWASIRAARAAWEHRILPVEGAGGQWQAVNPGQQWTTRFDGRGFTATPKGAPWRWGLELQSYGCGQNRTAVGGVPEVRAEGGRLTYQWDRRMEEWFINDARGLEHGFVLRERPAGTGDGQPLEVMLAVRGGLRARLSADGRTVHFNDDLGTSLVNYSGLKVWDADGRMLPSRFGPAGEKQVCLTVEDACARYPLTIDPVAQQAYLKAGNAGADDMFGISVAVSGDTVVVGASGETSKATGVNGDPTDNSAYAAGAAYVFIRSGTGWTQQAYLKAGNTAVGDRFGTSVAASGDTVVVGAPCDSGNSGVAYVFTRSGTMWTQQAYLKAGNTGGGDFFGSSVALSEDTVVVGARGEASSATGVNGNQADNSAYYAGAAYVFTRSGTAWTQQAYLKAGNTDVGDQFGSSVAVSGGTVVVGAYSEASNASGVNGNMADNSVSSSGAAYVFTRSGTTWTQQAYLKAGNTGAQDYFGYAVAVSGDTVVVGAHGEDSNAGGVNGNQADDSASSSGAAYVFTRSGTAWTQQAYLKAGNSEGGDEFGYAVAVSDETVVVGAHAEAGNGTGVNGDPTDNSVYAAGAAYVFTRSGTAWTQQAYLKAGNTGVLDYLGASVAVSGDTVVVGAYGEDSGEGGSNGNPADNSASSAGAAYIFTGVAPVAVTPLEEWRQLHFGTPVSDGHAADSFDYDHDGLANLLEWAVGTHPGQPNSYHPVMIRNGADLEFTYPRSLAAINAGTGYAVEWSGTLAEGSWQTTGVTESVLSTAGDVQTIRATVPAGAERRYMRLRVTTP